jgi:hypothetical protein
VKRVPVYTSRTTPLARLRTYYRELVGEYVRALRRRDYALARQVYDLRRRVRRDILIREEWDDGTGTAAE